MKKRTLTNIIGVLLIAIGAFFFSIRSSGSGESNYLLLTVGFIVMFAGVWSIAYPDRKKSEDNEDDKIFKK